MSTPLRTASKASAGVLALLVHVFFFTALMFGVSWNTLPPIPAYADLWQALPEWPQPEPEPAPRVTEPPPAPEPVKPPPPPERVEAAKPDIALKEKEQKREKARLEKERLQQAQKDELRRQEQAEKAQREATRKQEELRKELERALADQMAADLAAERRQVEAAEQRAAAAAARDRMILDYRQRIALKIRGLLSLPPNLQGNPEAIFRLRLLPNGEILDVTLVRSSGQPTYDAAVERAIRKASPLELPPDREAASVFRGNLQLKFRPLES